MSIHPVRNESDYETALNTIEHLMDLNSGANTAEADELEILTTLVEAWEDQHYPLPKPTPVELLHFVLEQGMISRKDLETALGSSARVSEVLGGERNLSAAMLVRLHEGFGLPLAPLIPRPRPEVWLDLCGLGRVSPRKAIKAMMELLAAAGNALSERVEVRVIPLDDMTTRLVLQAARSTDLRCAEDVVRKSFGSGVIARRQVAWPVAESA
ncbi:MAG: hypothetical protein HYV63_33690 [Candidatus Schekmanbacteria bacterium]|nr:hypothetical protein [Candidatus Schekmanbacteria bacterium]